MIWLLAILVAASILAMAWAFLAATDLEASVDSLESRAKSREPKNPEGGTP